MQGNFKQGLRSSSFVSRCAVEAACPTARMLLTMRTHPVAPVAGTAVALAGVFLYSQAKRLGGKKKEKAA